MAQALRTARFRRVNAYPGRWKKRNQVVYFAVVHGTTAKYNNMGKCRTLGHCSQTDERHFCLKDICAWFSWHRNDVSEVDVVVCHPGHIHENNGGCKEAEIGRYS